eukprot:Rmarinus@m.29314
MGESGMGMDCSIIPTRYGLLQVSTTDFFYPLVESPYLQGQIGCANVLSDLYALGLTHCDNLLMVLAASRDMKPDDRDIVTREMMRGFNDHAKKAGTMVTGGQSVLNPWPIIGGVAMCVAKEEEILWPEKACPIPGDVVVLTKPLGTQVAVNLKQWEGNEARWSVVEDVITTTEAAVCYEMACESMSRLNRNAAMLMMKHGARASTDVTGFGLRGHAENLAKHVKTDIEIHIHTLPCIKGTPGVNTRFNFRLLDGYSAETSGGIFAIMPAENARAFCDELRELDGQPTWIVGDVVAGSRTAEIVEGAKVLEIDPAGNATEWARP